MNERKKFCRGTTDDMMENSDNANGYFMDQYVAPKIERQTSFDSSHGASSACMDTKPYVTMENVSCLTNMTRQNLNRTESSQRPRQVGDLF